MFCRNRFIVLAIAVAAASVLSGCAARHATHEWGDKESGLILEYRMPEGETLDYEYVSEFQQIMTAQGQEIPIDSVQTLTFSIVSSGMQDEVYTVGVRIGAMHILVDTPEDGIDQEIEEVAGGSFDMTLSRIGEEGGLPANDALQFTLEAEGPRSVVPVFSAMFPDLPGRPIVTGESWPTEIDVVEEEGEGQTRLHLDVVNTLEGFEMFGERECARITSTFTGMITGNGVEQGARWMFESDTIGTGVTLFDFRNGVFVSDESTGTADGAITITGPMGEMEMPVTRTFIMTTSLAE
jgi:hypothetical protein